MKVIQKVNELLETMLEEADACDDDEKREHIYGMVDDLEDWATVYENRGYE